jgi:radical SAM protein with 4Fe4S-binding SPASM domain
MCPFGTGGFDESMQGMMPFNMALSALAEARSNGAMSVKLNFRGEPGLSKDLARLAEIAKALGYVDVMINTNMTAFSRQRIKELVQVFDTVIVSIDGANQYTYEKIRVNGDFERLRTNIDWFNFYRDKEWGDCKLIVQMTTQPSNVGQEEELKRIFKADEYKFSKMTDRTGNIARNQKRIACKQPHQRLIVAWDGTIFPCCHNWNNEYPLGNYNDITLKQAWDGERMKQLREYAKDPNKGAPCDTCVVGSTYG